MTVKKLFYLVALILCIGVYFYFSNVRMELKGARVLDQLDRCETIEDVIAILGSPYEIYETFPSKLGADLIEGDESSVVIYAFELQKIPPYFLVIKVSKTDKTIQRLGFSKS